MGKKAGSGIVLDAFVMRVCHADTVAGATSCACAPKIEQSIERTRALRQIRSVTL
jgi:hypothetical protein